MENTMEDQENLKIFLRQAELLHYYETFRNTLKVTKVSQLKFVFHGDLHQIGLSKPELRRYRELYSLYFPKPYLKKIKQILCAFGISEPMSLGHGHSCNPSDFQPFPENVSKVPTKHIISIEDIKINKQLGVGQFGVVQQGTWSTNNQRLHVAIKCLGHERMASSSSEFLKEAAVMHSIEHPNIVRLYGVVLHLDSLMLVTELAPLRSLLECLREVTLRTSFPVSNLCDFAQQICDGMTYLENKRLIHRDLAARNILVFSKSKVKISDFGLSRALSVGKDYYQTNYNVNLKLPVAWCAPECILYLRFTSASDVWAFGVCLWEMFTYGFQPWAAYSGQQILEAIDEPNYQRLERPECCPDAYYSTMLECWAHDPKFRPKFKELKTKLREIQPIQVQAITDFLQPQDGRRCNFLEYKGGQVITVLGKQNFTKSVMWYGVLPGGTCGMFDPSNTEPYVQREQAIPGSISLSARKATRKSALSRTDTKRHTYTGKRTLRCSMISSPQGDVKHTGHVGVDGASFGDISFLDPACTSGQIVTQYKLSEDLEQVPLLNPNSPSHLSGAMCMPPYPILKATYTEGRNDRDEVDLSYTEKKHKSPKKSKLKSLSEPSTSKSILNKVRSASLGRSQKHEVVQPVCTCSGSEVHEYHEISDTDTEGAAAEWMKSDNLAIPDSPGIPKSCNDFGQSLLDEMEYMFRNLDTRKRDEGMNKYVDNDNARPHTLSKADKKKGGNTGTMKLMSAHDERTLDTAVALANEIITKSMNDQDGDQRVPSSPIDRSKFHFKFPLVSLHQSASHDADAAGKYERRNFSEEAKSVPDIQSTITAESKLAYASLIEEPMPSTSLISHMEMAHKPATVPKPAPRLKEPRANFLSLQKELPINIRPSSSRDAVEQQLHTNNTINELPLPPRSTKPKLIDKPRHIRKYPLKLPNPNPNPEVSPKTNNEENNQVIIYQNAITCTVKHRNGQENNQKIYNQGVDVFDGPSRINFDTNPFTNTSEQRHPNPFNPPLTVTDNEDVCTCSTIERKSLGKDYVSVEDLLEFADQKPCGRQRGVESDEVRIMNKVLKHQTTPEECLEALEVSDWNVHQAIKVVKVKLTVNTPVVTLEECMRELANTAGDTTKAIAAIVAYLNDLRQ